MEHGAFACSGGWISRSTLPKITPRTTICRRTTSRRRVVIAAVNELEKAGTPPVQSPKNYGAPGVISFRPLESNSWVLEVGTKRVFVDPWLVGTLCFGDPKFYEAKKTIITPSTSVTDFGPIDLVVLSQELPDHCHVPTLTQLDKSIPVVCCPSAREILAKLGFKKVTVLKHGQSTKFFDESLTISAFPGSLVGPPWSERMNAYAFDCRLGINDPSVRTNYKLFYEPHADVPESTFAEVGPVDGVLAPSVQVNMLPGSLNYPLVKGGEATVDIIEKLGARDAVILRNNTTKGSGVLDKIISEQESHEDFEKKLRQKITADVRVVYQEIGEAGILAQAC